MGKPLPVIRMDEQAAHDAFEAHSAMLLTERRLPGLKRNEYWKALRDTAMARFLAAFEAL
jgi:hypothetical protein